MEQVYQLVNTLSDPVASSREKQEAQATFQQYQKSPNGLEIAQALLNSDNTNSQFLGALTYTVKLNEGLDADKAVMLRESLIEWLRIGTSRSYAPFVIRKILSTLANLFLRTPQLDWTPFIGSIAQIVGSDMASEFLTMIVEDTQTLKSSIRPAIEPILPLVVSLIGPTSKSLALYRVWATNFFDLMSPLLPQIIPMLVNEEVSEDTASTLKDLYEIHHSSWPKDSKQLLSETVMFVCNSGSRQEDFSRLVLTICLQDFTANTQFHPYIVKVLTNPGISCIDDPLASEVLEFWTEFAEDEPKLFESEGLVSEVVGSYWERVKLFSGCVANWDEFNSFRSYFKDFLEVIYPISGPALLDHLVGVILNNLPNQNWIDIECALDCLRAFQDVIENELEHILPLVQNSQTLWSTIATCPNVRVLRTAASSIGIFTKLFTQDAAAMSPALGFLFTCLSQPSLQISASRGISQLFEKCSNELTRELDSILQAYSELRSSLLQQGTADSRVLTAISWVINACTEPSVRAANLHRLIDIILVDGPSLDALRSLDAVGSGLKGPYEALRQSPHAAEGTQQISLIRQRILTVVQSTISSSDSELCAALCKIFKGGLCEMAEDTPFNPFSFEPTAVLEFVVAKFQMGPSDCRPLVVDLASRIISTQKAESRELSNDQIQILLANVLSTPHASVDARSNCLQLLGDLAPTVKENIPSAIIYDLALPSISVPDKFVVRAAANFWTQFIPYINAEMGQLLIRELMKQFAGVSDRSDLEQHVDILRKLVRAHPRAVGKWLQQEVIDAPATPEVAKQDVRVRSEFVAQLQLVRGSSQTKQIATKFWLHCRGIPEKY